MIRHRYFSFVTNSFQNDKILKEAILYIILNVNIYIKKEVTIKQTVVQRAFFI